MRLSCSPANFTMGQQSSKTKPSMRTDIIRGSSKSLRRERIPSNIGNPTRRQANGITNHQKLRNNTYDVKKNRVDAQIINHEKRSANITARHVQHSVSSRTQNAPSTIASAKERATKEPSGTTENHIIQPVTATPDVPNCRDQCAQTHLTLADVARLKHQRRHHELAIQAFAITIQYLTKQVDQEINKKINERDEHQRNINRLHEELEAQYVERVESLEATVRDEQREVTRLQGVLAENAKEHRLIMTRIQSEHANEIARKEAEVERKNYVSDQGAALVAEAESLRSVLELKSEEVAALRAENDVLRRQLEAKDVLEQRVMTLEARCEDLKAQVNTKESNERNLSHENVLLLESYQHVTKLNERYHQRIEELEWKLKEKKQWYKNHNSHYTSTSSANNSLSRSYGTDKENSTNQSWTANSDLQVPNVKYFIEKSASVSWTLDMNEYANRNSSADHTPRMSKSTTSVSRQNSLRLPSKSRHRSFETARTRSNSFTEALPLENNWAPPNGTSTPKNRRNNMSNRSGAKITESSMNGPMIVVDGVDEANSGPRPQEAGGEAMISEETSASSSEDESSAGSDIHTAITSSKTSWRKATVVDQ